MSTVQVTMSPEERQARLYARVADLLVENDALRDGLAEAMAQLRARDEKPHRVSRRKKGAAEPTPIRPPDDEPPVA